LNFVTGQKWRYGALRTVQYLVTISQMAAELLRFSVFQNGGLLDFGTGEEWRYGLLWTVHVYHRAKFCKCMSTGGSVIGLLRFVENGCVRHFEFVFCNSGPPTKFTYGPEVAQRIWC